MKIFVITLLAGILLMAGYGLYKTHTEPADLRTKTGVLAGCPPRPSCVSSVSEDEMHRIAPIGYSSDVENVRDILESAVRSMPGAQMQTATADYLHVVYVTPTMRFRDDVELLIQPSGYIDVRSVSRFGYGDHGVNRARVEALRAAFDARRGGN